MRKWLMWGMITSVIFIAGYLAVPVRAAGFAIPHPQSPEPLPHDCDGFSPPDYPQPVCCMAGYVHYATPTRVEPEIVMGAQVTLTTASSLTTTTTLPGIHNAEGLAYFKFDLDALGVLPGDWVTVTASHLEKRHQVAYQVTPGGQQVDIVLPEARNFEAVTVIVDDQDAAASPDDVGFHITGPVELLTESACGAGSEFWEGVIYSGDSTADGVGPATITATYRAALPVSGAYELFAHGPHGCASSPARYEIHIPGHPVTVTLVDQQAASESAIAWVSLGVFDFPGGADSYVQLTNVTGRVTPRSIGFDALKWELRTPFPAITTVIVDDLDITDQDEAMGFYINDATWGKSTAAEGSDSPNVIIAPPLYWQDQIYWTRSVDQEAKRENWAHWRPYLPVTGMYDLSVHISSYYAAAHTARYRLYVQDQIQDTVILNQAVQGGIWAPLGSYPLPAGTSSYVYLDDWTGESMKWLSFDAVRWTLRPSFPPVAVIHNLSAAAVTQGMDTLIAYGSGVDTDGGGTGIVTYEWRSDLDGILATTRTLTRPADTLSLGLHTLTFQVQDDEGLWSSPVTSTLEVLPPALGDSWHLMFYFAGDNNLSSHLSVALLRIQQMSLTANLTLTVQFDRLGAGGVTRYALLPGGGFQQWSLGEQNTGLTDTLSAYLEWARTTYPAEHTYLAIADHGRGIQGLAWDETSGNDNLSLPELREALEVATGDGLYKIDVLHLDACLMGMLEVGYEIYPYADYLIASENIAWASFNYERYIQALVYSPTPRAWATAIAEIYHNQFQNDPHTISVLDLQALPVLANKVDGLAGALIVALNVETPTLSSVLSQVQRLDSRDYGHITLEDEFIDLRHFSELLIAAANDPAVIQAAQAVFSATQLSQTGVLTTAIIYEQHRSGSHAGSWWNLDHAGGIALYFPPSNLGWDYPGYVLPALRFGHNTQWDELLRAFVGEAGITPNDPPVVPEPLQMQRIYLPLIMRDRG